MLIITKANGEREPFDSNKLKRSLYRSGASKQIVEKVATQVQANIKNNESTSEIYKKAFKRLKQERSSIAAVRYSLKKAILELGPTGYPFEYFVAKLFEAQGYNVQVGKIFDGLCVCHELDIVANKGNETILVEAKFRNIPGASVGVKVPLYMKSRFDDILLKKNKEKRKDFRCMIFTNSRFSRDAIRYSRCSGALDLVGWSYPNNKGLEKIVEKLGLHPITVLDILSKKEKEKLFKNGFVVCRDINQNPRKLKKIALPKNKITKIIDQSESLCNL
jgi:hypothetical protein